jgi:hypothetical protein
MYTVLWQEGETDHWERLESKEETLDLLLKLKANPDVCEYDIWVFTPKADMFALDYNMFFDDEVGADSDEDPRYIRLKLALVSDGPAAVSEFIGEPVSKPEDESLMDYCRELIDNAYQQMPEEELEKFFERYQIPKTSSN